MSAAQALGRRVGRKAACRALDLPRASFYRHLRPNAIPPAPRPKPSRALDDAERQAIMDMLHSERFRDQAPNQVFATLLDEGTYLCSIRTMYRILDQAGELRERRDQLRHPNYSKPELLATGPNEVWSWDITKLLGPVKWTYFYLYVILDIFSRYVAGWMVAHRESAELAERLIEESCRKQGILPGQLTLHADRGSSMTSKPVAFLLSDLGVTKTHSRPHVSDDNPFSESQFKTLKYRPEFPQRFGSIQDCSQLLPGLLPLVQRGASAQRHRSAHARDPALRPRRRRDPMSPGRAEWRLRTPPRTFRPSTPQAARKARSRLDQPAGDGA
jgi:putative transposase